jgi:serine protease Do
MSRFLSRSLVVCSCLFLLGAAQAQASEGALSRPDLYRQTLHATVRIVTPDGAGSGWVVDRDRRLVITNAHVVGDNDTVQVVFPEFKDGRVIADRLYYRLHAHPIAAKVLRTDPRRDLAVLELASLPDGTAPLKLAADSPSPGEDVFTIGNPALGGGLWVFTDGMVRQVSTFHGKPLGKDLPHRTFRAVETQMPLYHGDSGGPLVNDRGELVGVNECTFARRHDFSVHIDVSAVRQFLNDSRALSGPAAPEEFLRRAAAGGG